MADFIGSKCEVCKEKFQKGDDIVVCPECGTPYHRSCWNLEGRCVNEKMHGTGEFWKPDVLPEADLRCPNCGTKNLPNAYFCSNCGKQLGGLTSDKPVFKEGEAPEGAGAGPFQPAFTINFGDPLCGFNPEESFEEVPIKEVAEYVKSNTFYFLPQFKVFKETGRKFSLNLSAVLLRGYYFLYRKMYGTALIIILLEAILAIPQLISLYADNVMAGTAYYEFASQFNVSGPTFQLLLQLSSWVSLGIQIIAGIFANRLYYSHVLRRIKSVHKGMDTDSPDEEQLHSEIKRRGGVNLPVAVILFFVSAMINAVLFYPVISQLY